MLGFYTMAEADNIVHVTDVNRKDIHVGTESIIPIIADSVKKIKKKKVLLGIDGFIGIAWKERVEYLAQLLRMNGLEVTAFAINECYIDPPARDIIVQKCLEVDPYWGRVYDGFIEDFLDTDKASALRDKIKGASGQVIIVYGPGALSKGFKELYDLTGYFDATREDIFTNIDNGTAEIISSPNITQFPESLIRRRITYVDFEILKKQKHAIIKSVTWYFIDHPNVPLTMVGIKTLGEILETLSKQPFRMKPYYFPRIWGGDHLIPIRKLPMKKCSFYIEINPSICSIRILAGNTILDIPFLTFMWFCGANIVGEKILNYFHGYFPLSANYDDTISGGSLALQCHPGKDTMQKKYNEDNTHDESYYVVKAERGAKTCHGLVDGVNWDEYRKLAERAEKEHIPFDYEKYVHYWESAEGDLYLFPGGTTHASGENQIVLELDADGSKNGAEYTFHVYDFLRPDMDGSYRAIHNDHYFGEVRQQAEKAWTNENLKQPPKLIGSGDWGKEYCLGDYHEMSYISNRIELKKGGIYKANQIDGGFCDLVLTKGDSILIRPSGDATDKGYVITYTEGIVVPATLQDYEIINLGGDAHIIKTFIRENPK